MSCAALFVTCLLTANTMATKLITVGGVVLTAGIVIFPVSYVIGDVLTEVWGYGAFVLSRTVDSHVAELRRKIEDDPAHPRHVITVFKIGYRLEP